MPRTLYIKKKLIYLPSSYNAILVPSPPATLDFPPEVGLNFVSKTEEPNMQRPKWKLLASSYISSGNTVVP